MNKRLRKKMAGRALPVFGGITIDRVQLEQACRDIGEFVRIVERLLAEVEADYSKTANFIAVSEKLVKVKGDARQLNLGRIGDLAEVAEELAVKGAAATERPIIRRVIGALWDSITTLKHMLEHAATDTSDEAGLLFQRLDKALESLGGARQRVSQADISALFSR